jgi:DNA-binding response OmpR family regulator
VSVARFQGRWSQPEARVEGGLAERSLRAWPPAQQASAGSDQGARSKSDGQATRSEEGKALLIESDEAYLAVMTSCLRLAGCRSTVAAAPELAFPMLERHSFDVVVWGVSGDQVDRRLVMLGELRLRSEAPLIMVDGGFEAAQLDLEAGADKWVPKPFAPGLLVGTVRAALRKSASSVLPVAARTEVRGMMLDSGRRKLVFSGSEVSFTRQEWDLLSILVSHPDRFLGAREILRLGWSAGDHAAEQLRTYVHRLRQKLEPMDLPCQLLSQHGHGYCLRFDGAGLDRRAPLGAALGRLT